MLAEIHFAPTPLSRDNLLAEGVAAEKVVVTGNTVIDTFRALSVLLHSSENTPWAGIPDDNSRLVLVTSHRRESWGTDQEHMCMRSRVDDTNVGMLLDRYARRRRTLALADTLVAAIAIERRCALMVANRKDFPMPEPNCYNLPQS